MKASKKPVRHQGHISRKCACNLSFVQQGVAIAMLWSQMFM